MNARLVATAEARPEPYDGRDCAGAWKSSNPEQPVAKLVPHTPPVKWFYGDDLAVSVDPVSPSSRSSSSQTRAGPGGGDALVSISLDPNVRQDTDDVKLANSA